MATPQRILFVSSEVTPYTPSTPVADLARHLPDQLQQRRGSDVRLMMPRYGTISERKNRLHEVIRLSGTAIPMGERTAKLDVKVASLPDTRLQVYFMDSKEYFKRKGIYTDRDGEAFTDNVERAYFFGRAVIETLLKLRWAPEVIHAAGACAALLPYLLRRVYDGEALLAETRVVYTPERATPSTTVTEEITEALGLELDPTLAGAELVEVGAYYADRVLLPAGLDDTAEATRLSGDQDTLGEEARACYEGLNLEVAA